MTLSTFIHLHIGIGWSGVTFGFIALGLRAFDFLCLLEYLPPSIISAIKFWHSIFGGLFVAACLFMPITANWIWPRYGTPYEIIILIVSMYLSLVIGIICIRLYKYLNLKENDYELVVSAKVSKEISPNPVAEDDQEQGVSLTQQQQQVVIPAETNFDSNLQENSALSSSLATTSKTQQQQRRSSKKYIFLKYAHGILMLFSLVMLLGAGQAFLSNSRINNFPYGETNPVTDSLVGRCYGRNLISPDVPGWLANLTCGYTSMCQVSSRSGASNPDYLNSFG